MLGHLCGSGSFVVWGYLQFLWTCGRQSCAYKNTLWHDLILVLSPATTHLKAFLHFSSNVVTDHPCKVMENTAVNQTQNTSISLGIKLALSWWCEWSKHAWAVQGIPRQLAAFLQPHQRNSLCSKIILSFLCQGCHNRAPQTRWLRVKAAHCLTGLEARSPKNNVSAGPGPLWRC